MTTKGLFPKIWRWTKRIFIILFIAQFVYIILLKWIDPPITITQFVSFVTGHGLRRDYVDREDISPNARLAVMASEDQKFPDHSGFDWKSIRKAMEYNKRKPGRTRGASTISQQVAKNVFLWQGKSKFRKGLEAYFTFMIEHIWGKKRILEMYLNVIEMGDGIFGIEKAANVYFKKKARDLTLQEAARIASCLPNPKVMGAKVAASAAPYKTRKIMQQMIFLHNDPDIEALMEKPPRKKGR
ncbi:MAG TPA: monofunctional biosynthetic peptidoglycan transglycosylase [Chryseolinea sp.]|nr:monofunctional biosynthetic peptidoglycan transglycosylase [Chryseolinea sp.]